MPSTRSRLAATGLTAVVVLGVGAVAATPALAHARLVSSSPAAGATVAGGLSQLTLHFDDPVTLVPNALTLTTDRGGPVALESPRVLHGTTLAARLQDRLASGRYTVAWRIRADDGHIESDTFAFAVAGAGAATGGGGQRAGVMPAAPATPAQPVWPVLVAVAVALAAGTGAAFIVRRGLRLVTAAPVYPDDSTSPKHYGASRLPM